MKIIVAPSAGYCFGVRRAIEMAQNAAATARPNPVYTIGPLIHNRRAVAALADNGIKVAAEKELAALPPGTRLIISAHGLSPQAAAARRTAGQTLTDATCPRVLESHKILRQAAKDGVKSALIIGDRAHPEVTALLGVAQAARLAAAQLTDRRELPAISILPPPYLILAQTTFAAAEYKMLTQEILARLPGGKVYETVCAATQKRQNEALALAQSCDLVIVAGCPDSANTRRLVALAQEKQTPAQLVEDCQALAALKIPPAIKTLGLTAGASTAPETVAEILASLKTRFPRASVETLRIL